MIAVDALHYHIWNCICSVCRPQAVGGELVASLAATIRAAISIGSVALIGHPARLDGARLLLSPVLSFSPLLVTHQLLIQI